MGNKIPLWFPVKKYWLVCAFSSDLCLACTDSSIPERGPRLWHQPHFENMFWLLLSLFSPLYPGMQIWMVAIVAPSYAGGLFHIPSRSRSSKNGCIGPTGIINPLRKPTASLGKIELLWKSLYIGQWISIWCIHWNSLKVGGGSECYNHYF